MAAETIGENDPVPALAAIMGRLGKPPDQVRILNPRELREIEARMASRGQTPFSPDAQGICVNVVSVLGILMPTFLIAISLPSVSLLTDMEPFGIFWFDALVFASIAFMVLGTWWISIFIIRSSQSYIFKTYLVFDRDKIHRLREGFLYRRIACFPREDIVCVDLVIGNRGFNAWWVLSSGERIAPVRPFALTAETSWFAWFFHLALRKKLTGNVPLCKLSEKLLSGTMKQDDMREGNDPPELAEDQSPAIAAPSARDTDRFTVYGVGDPGVPHAVQRVMEEKTPGPRPTFAVLVNRRDWRSALHLLPGMTLFCLFLLYVDHKPAPDVLGRLKDWGGYVGVCIIIVMSVTLFLHFLLARIWLVFSGERIVRRREWGLVRLTRTFDTRELEATELVRQNRDGDKYDLHLRFGGGKRPELIGSLRAGPAERLAGAISRWTETPVLRRKAIPPGDFPPRGPVAADPENRSPPSA